MRKSRFLTFKLSLYSGKPVPTRTSRGEGIERLSYLDTAKCLDPNADWLDAVLSLPNLGQQASQYLPLRLMSLSETALCRLLALIEDAMGKAESACDSEEVISAFGVPLTQQAEGSNKRISINFKE